MITNFRTEAGEDPNIGLFDDDFPAAKVIYNKSERVWNVDARGRVLL
jgi:hypothetical protein